MCVSSPTRTLVGKFKMIRRSSSAIDARWMDLEVVIDGGSSEDGCGFIFVYIEQRITRV